LSPLDIKSKTLHANLVDFIPGILFYGELPATVTRIKIECIDKQCINSII
jgi:hypothetical protein